MNKKIMMRLLQVLSLLVIFVMPIISTSAKAADFNQGISQEDQAQFDEMLKPVMKIYNLIKYAASFIAGIVFLIAAITFMTSGGDPRKRDVAKNTAMYVVIGLVVIWVAPLAVNYIL
ncbi:pilin [Candidatus Woesearchaeota archaeon]|nr:pilin [Candidatus Woesearchaeota archaeon]